jgi:preprotein translocase subunit YajC
VHLSSHVLAVLAAGTTAKGSSGGGGSSIVSFLPLILIVLVGYFLLLRPARMRQRKSMESRAAISPGAEVTTTAGILGTVISINEEDDTVTLEIAPGVQPRFLKGAIARVHSPFEPEPDPEPPTGAHEAIDAEPEPDAGSDTGTGTGPGTKD